MRKLEAVNRRGNACLDDYFGYKGVYALYSVKEADVDSTCSPQPEELLIDGYAWTENVESV